MPAGDTSDEAKSNAHAHSEFLDMHICICLCVDSKDLFSSLSTQDNSIDGYLRADVASIRCEF